MSRLIDADALTREIIFVKKCLASEDKAGEWANGYRSGLVAALAQIDELPTVDAVPVVHGRWEWWETMGITFARCSVCDDTVDADEVVSFAFCPYCGADMRESKED